MLDEIPVLSHTGKTKIFTAPPTVLENLPYISSRISFRPFINHLKETLPVVSETKERLYQFLISKFEAEPELLRDITDEDVLSRNSELLELLSTSLFPLICHDQNNFALATPYHFRVFYYSEKFKDLFLDNNEQYLMLPEGLSMDKLKSLQSAAIYDQVLEKYYGMNLNEEHQLIYPIAHPSGMTRYYRIKYDRRFTELHLKGALPPIQDCGVCMNTFRILDLEKQLATMPLNLFEVEGFALWIAEDVTTSESMEIIKRILLRENCNNDVIDELKSALQALVGLNDVKVGITPFVTINGQIVLDEETCRHSLAGRQWLDGTPESLNEFKDIVDFMKAQPFPMPVSNVNEEMFQVAPFMRRLYEEGTRSYLFYPIQNSEGLIGFLELASPVKNQLTQETVTRLEPAIPLISLALLKCRDGFDNRIEKLIREKFTALQQSVEWKFAEVAWDHLRNNNKGSTKNVVFDNVYPLYGAVDIRNSSVERSNAIQKDLKSHLEIVTEILQSLQAIVQLPLLEGLEFRISNIRQSIEENMTAEDEIRINDFIITEVEPLLQNLSKTNNRSKQITEDYFSLRNQSRSRLNQHRNEYEESVAMINNSVLSYLEAEEEIIQQSYPHYFEKYRTDGVEYNIYIGQSIAPNIPFELFYLKNIRLWQLKVMAGAAQVTHALLPSLKLPLHTTQLILIHNYPISISFRRDERKFDVEGSYNIRYEIIKKRLDKVRIKETNERLTQPGKIAIVYSNQKEATEYEEYIYFLQKKNMLKEGIEMLDLEELQGIKGLRAMRVSINMD